MSPSSTPEMGFTAGYQYSTPYYTPSPGLQPGTQFSKRPQTQTPRYPNISVGAPNTALTPPDSYINEYLSDNISETSWGRPISVPSTPLEAGGMIHGLPTIRSGSEAQDEPTHVFSSFPPQTFSYSPQPQLYPSVFQPQYGSSNGNYAVDPSLYMFRDPRELPVFQGFNAPHQYSSPYGTNTWQEGEQGPSNLTVAPRQTKRASKQKRTKNNNAAAETTTPAEVTPGTHVCDILSCYRRFKRAEHLKRHIKSVHNKELGRHCPFCTKVFNRNRLDNYRQHLRLHTLNTGRTDYDEGAQAVLDEEASRVKQRRRPQKKTAAQTGQQA